MVAALCRANLRFRPALQLQELRVRNRSVSALVDGGDVGCDLLFHPPFEMPVGEMKDVGKLFNLLEDVGAGGKALQDLRNRPAIVRGLPASVNVGGFALRVV